jgi:large subunit ribosomal protein L35
MPKLKTHKGIKKRFKVSATGKVSHKRCGSSHLNSHKSGKRVRRLRKKSIMKVSADAKRLRRAVRVRESAQPDAIEAARLAALAESQAEAEAAPAAETAAQG